jgi:hypothetical protein
LYGNPTSRARVKIGQSLPVSDGPRASSVATAVRRDN